MRRNPWLLAAVIVAVAALCATWVAKAPSAVDQSHSTTRHSTLAGTWSGRYSGAFSGTFTLHWTQSGSILRGSIALSNPRGKYGISGSVRGRAIKFGAVGVGATYTGSVSGKSMSGSYKSPQGGGNWSAHKTS
jgi:hypothetical protein